jgi:glycosyltransferase involved in cell wall biosynthesis
VANFAACAERVVAIPHGLLHEAMPADNSVITRFGLAPGGYLLYPANFWPHKNHRRLFEALRLRPNLNVRLVCTGAPNALMQALAREAEPLGVVFAGYVSPAELAGLLQSCAGLVFPSLYEGFGMPVLEAMALGKPVLCSNVTSLPEVAGNAAIYFDPASPEQIATAIETLQHEHPLVAELVRLGRVRARAFGTARDMAGRYLALFHEVLAAGPG